MTQQRFNDHVASLTLAKLRELCRTLGHYCAELQIYAKRYTIGRQTYAPGAVNDITRHLLELGLILNPGSEGTIWAADGGGRRFDLLSDEQLVPGHPLATGLIMPLPEGVRIDDALIEAFGSRDPVEVLAKWQQLQAEVERLKGITRFTEVELEK